MNTDSSQMTTDKSQITILEKDLSFKLRGLFINISRLYGHLYKEEFYHNALAELLEKNKINFVSQPKIKIHSFETGRILSTYNPDFLIENRIIIELKALPCLYPNATIQLDQYLKASEYELGFLINFGEPMANIIRRIYTNDRKSWLKTK